MVNQLFGVVSGLGMGVLDFDWNQISYIGSPLMVPWWAEVHIMIGFVMIYWLVVPLLYYSDVSVFDTRSLLSLLTRYSHRAGLALCELPNHGFVTL